jgi:hypothetical protein
MRRIIFLSLALLLTTSVFLAEDFWIKKEYMQWSDEEVKKLLSNSPWAKDVYVNAPMSAIYGRGQRTAATEASGTDAEAGGGGGGGGRGRGRGGGGGAAGGGGGTAEQMVVLNISWRSALPMRKAVVRSRLGVGAAVPPEAQQVIDRNEDVYVIVVTGVPNPMAGAVQNRADVEKTTLRAGKKDPIAAREVSVQPHRQTVDLVYAFPKTATITADDKEVEVVVKLGQIEAKRKFSLKDMVYNGKLEL